MDVGDTAVTSALAVSGLSVTPAEYVDENVDIDETAFDDLDLVIDASDELTYSGQVTESLLTVGKGKYAQNVDTLTLTTGGNAVLQEYLEDQLDLNAGTLDNVLSNPSGSTDATKVQVLPVPLQPKLVTSSHLTTSLMVVTTCPSTTSLLQSMVRHKSSLPLLTTAITVIHRDLPVCNSRFRYH